ncbi:hypothetical protein BDV34DRAFT_216025 [Aspergillus parasiticus]|uniref:Homeobox KN domain protein n=1 Tax=Aspergillus parasiticus TaxID=5067 RepID=A0A5N6D9E3_ASPPA|nr:hypothetical protein BDV34DRAFT_216025 [Aspergillus parasiticus]
MASSTDPCDIPAENYFGMFSDVELNEMLRSMNDNMSRTALGSPRLKRSTSTFSQDQLNVLEQWLDLNLHCPYPTKEEKRSLAGQTGLSISQVSTWFTNARRRLRQTRSASSCKGSSIPESPISLRERQFSGNPQWASMTPLDRWRNSPPEIEAAPLEAIVNAVARSDTDNKSNQSFGSAASAPCNLQHAAPLKFNDARSFVSSEASASGLSSSSGSSAGSIHSQGSFGRFYLDDPSRRKRRRRTGNPAVSYSRTAKTAVAKRPFQCTFCTDTFRTKHDWTRHERTLHLALVRFICSPSGPTYIDSSNGGNRCCFCDELCPSDSHIDAHRFNECQLKPAQLRTFYRKDHLVQHLRLVHGVNQAGPAMESWKSQVTHINSRCGFCDQRFEVWSERNDHIAQHFRNGASMKDWRGCRGLDPPIALAVENAMPPYLIGIESTGMAPFSASHMLGKDVRSHLEATAQPPQVQAKPTMFEHLTARLGEYVLEVQAKGEMITDEMLQKEARCIIYGDDDPWNQTAADSPEWLKLFKEGVGIGSTEDTSQCRPSIHTGGVDYHFCLPWSADEWVPFKPSADSTAPASGDMLNTCMTWQSPECLAEYRQHTMTQMAIEISVNLDTLPKPPRCQN